MSKGATRLEDLARMAGVSISTASRALNDSPAVNQRTKQLIWKLAREMDYPFRRYMPAGPIGAEGTIAIVVPRPQHREGRLSDPFFLELFAGVGEAARERGCDILVSHVAPGSFEDLSAAMTTSRADGVIFLGQSWLHTAFNRLAETEARFVVWGAQLPDQAYCSVGSDNPLGAKRATLHLARLGRKRIVFLGDTEAPEAMQRHRGYLDAVEQFGLGVDPDLIVPAHFEVESAEASIDSLIQRGVKFDGVVAASDLIALGAIRALQHAGLSVPGDVSVIGYDDVPFARYSRPALSTISQDTAKAGRLMVSKLLDASGQGASRSERVPTDLIIRESCGG
ncbi:LacI family transcriptional regulator [Caulobacter zeae]|uniref:LacI family transcriptional regulator n=2 Tax=Caulobacter TaxID=75 RepID=A0A2N5DEC5_9CAUL|nr:MULTISPECIES: LacI family DNA-binding transcriptional regulator [Caulobacter]NGM51897.1 LacI family transcriptional regulator [Caulobacter sp. 602-2]PXA88227.1 LacI family transcriptional regulator [Caulobacter sp. D4A]PXA93529.1 LacI family transcriptional regulator [Caulobacter sp. D5]PLR24421.1 LacI family transcriptional regulator [Caulobacter zeae]PVM91395.1 LacI family transcriptional regulator [Caulobacter radicis]